MQPYHPWKQVREKPPRVAQEGALALHAQKLLEEGKGQHLGVREPFEGLVSLGARV